jgi:uncharacterized membrane-anchored protein YjiN (DUF445 family)
MQAIATGLLALMAVVFVGASLGVRSWPWLAYVRAFSEAAMVGACADWFAVTALFRRPLGLPIPHTGIIPRNKDRIGQSLGVFIADNFLTVEVLEGKIRQLELARWGGDWLRKPENARALAQRIAALAPEVLDAGAAESLRRAAAAGATAAVRAVPAAPTASRILSAAWNDGRAQPVLDWAVARLADYLDAHAETIQAAVEAKSYPWMPKFVDRIIAEKITAGLLQLLNEMSEPDHPWRRDLGVEIERFILRLAEDPELHARGEALKARLMADPGLRRQAEAIWIDLEARLRGGASQTFADTLETLLRSIGEWLYSDAGAHGRLNEVAEAVARRVIAPRRQEIGRFVAQVVASWDTRSITEKLELQVGKDLQYIRVNGTLVGGLAGLSIHIVSQAVGL